MPFSPQNCQITYHYLKAGPHDTAYRCNVGTESDVSTFSAVTVSCGRAFRVVKARPHDTATALKVLTSLSVPTYSDTLCRVDPP